MAELAEEDLSVEAVLRRATDEAFDRGYDEGYRDGWDDGFGSGYEAGAADERDAE